VADQGVVKLSAASDRPGDDLPAVHADADAELAVVRSPDGVEDLGRGPKRVIGVVLEWRRRTEHRQQAVTHELVWMTLVRADDRDDEVKEPAQILHNRCRSRALRQRGEVTDVKEQHRHLDLAATQDLAL